MTPPLFLVDVLPPADIAVLSGPEGRHAVRVRRIGAGERVDLGDGRGSILRCEVTAVGAEELRLTVLARKTVLRPDPELVVVQALAKGERAELAVELLTELGVDEIVPWAADRSIVRWQGERGVRALERWRLTAREAAKQSRRPWVPQITDQVTSAAAVAALVAASAAAYVLHEAADEPLTAEALPATGRILLVVGPEGGVTDAEVATLTAAGAVPVRLGSEVLRTSTAGAAAVAALATRLGRWS